jgi:hypothetical protein
MTAPMPASGPKQHGVRQPRTRLQTARDEFFTGGMGLLVSMARNSQRFGQRECMFSHRLETKSLRPERSDPPNMNFLGFGASYAHDTFPFTAMKKRLLLLTLTVSLIALPPFAGAKDKDKDKDKDRDDHDKKEWKVMRDDVRELREQYGRLVDLVNLGGVGRRVRDDVSALGVDVDRVGSQFDHGNFDYRDLHNRVFQLTDAVARTRDQINNDKQRPRYYPR